MEQTKIAYLAALIDGEGSIMLLKDRPSDKYRHPVISIANTSENIINFLKDNFGGCVCTKKIYKAHHKQSYSWSLINNAAIELLQLCEMFLIHEEKKYRAQLILSEYKELTRRNGKYSMDEAAKKLDFEERFLYRE